MTRADQVKRGARRTEASAHTGHLDAPKISDTRYSIEDAIQVLSPHPTMAQLVALFNSRATYDTIRDWRTGRHNTPVWARDLLAAKMQARADNMAHNARRTAAITAGPGRAVSTANILAWHARRKEKARNGAGS